MSKKRIYFMLPDQVEEQVIGLASRLGVTKSQMTIMCITAGIGSILRAFFPEESISSEKMAEIVKIIEEKRIEDEKRAENAKVG